MIISVYYICIIIIIIIIIICLYCMKVGIFVPSLGYLGWARLSRVN